jgi:spermidine/putrescine transport system permease protein
VAVLVVGVVLPVGVFVVYGFWRSDIFGIVRDWTFDQYKTVFTDALARTLLLRTLLLATIIASVTIPLAYATAYVLTFSVRRGRTVILVLIAASTLASYLVRIYAWKTILGPEGIINRGLEGLGIIDAPLSFLLYGKFAVVVTLVHILLPFAVLPLYASMQTLDRSVIEASRDLGAGPVTTFFRTTLPLTIHGAVIAYAFVFILAAGDYVTPLLVGGQGSSLVGRLIYLQFGFSQNFSLASALAVTLVFYVAIALLVALLLARTVTWVGGHARTKPRRRSGSGKLSGRVRALPYGKVFLGGVLVFLFAPIATIVLFSFNDSSFATFPLRGITLRWYEKALGSDEIVSGLVTSVELSAAVVAMALAVGVPAGFVLARRRFVGRGAVIICALLPIALPGMILGFAIFLMFDYIGREPSLLSAGLGQLVFVLPFVVLVTLSRLQGFDRTLEEAGRDLGCTARGVLRRVTLPIVWPVLAAAGFVAFALAMDEFIITKFTIGEQETLPVVIWGLMSKRGIDPSINAIASLVMVTSMAAIVVLGAVVARKGRVRA